MAMISDVLHDARKKIEEYLDDPTFKRCYEAPELRGEIEKCLREMVRVQRILDAPPVDALPPDVLRGTSH